MEDIKLEILGKTPRNKRRKPKLNTIVAELLETRLFVGNGSSFIKNGEIYSQLILIDTLYVLIPMESRNGMVWIWKYQSKKIAFEEIFDNIPKNLAEKIIYHLNIIPR